MKLKTLTLAALAALALSLPVMHADDYVQPQALSGIALYRDVTGIGYSTNVYYTQGAPLLLTNMVCYATANLGTNSVLQGLDGVTVELATSTSSTTTGTWITAEVQVATQGTWMATIPALPYAGTIYWQCRITDVSTNVYYYQQQMITAVPHL